MVLQNWNDLQYSHYQNSIKKIDDARHEFSHFVQLIRISQALNQENSCSKQRHDYLWKDVNLWKCTCPCSFWWLWACIIYYSRVWVYYRSWRAITKLFATNGDSFQPCELWMPWLLKFLFISFLHKIKVLVLRSLSNNEPIDPSKSCVSFSIGWWCIQDDHYHSKHQIV